MYIGLLVTHATTERCELQLRADGELIGNLSMRNAQLLPFILQVKPTTVIVDSEHTTDDLRRRLRTYPQVQYF